MADADADDILAGMVVPGADGVFLLGSLSRPLSLYSQQVRALNLAAALRAKGKGRLRVAIVGGGAAGVTAAAALLVGGHEVRLFEQKQSLLWFFDGSTRYLDPHLYDWPAPGWERAEAGLPLLNWTAGEARDVREHLLLQWNAIESLYSGSVKVQFGTVVTDVVPGTRRRWKVTFESADSAYEADVVLLAVGFGIERDLGLEHGVADARYVPYWQADNLDNPNFRYAKAQTCLISGGGDGAFIDALRVALAGFRQATQIAKILKPEGESTHEIKPVEEALSRIEAELLRRDANAAATRHWLHDQYQQLPPTPKLDLRLIAARESRRQDYYRVTIAGGTASWVVPGAYVLNRFLIHRLVSLERIEYLPTETEHIDHPDGSPATVAFKSGGTRQFDRVVKRHGAIPSLKRLTSVWAALKAANQLAPRPDLFHTPRWDNADPIEDARRARLVADLATYAPPENRATARRTAIDVVETLLRFIRGQLSDEKKKRGPSSNKYLPLAEVDRRAAEIHEALFAESQDEQCRKGDVIKLVTALERAWDGPAGTITAARAAALAFDKAFGQRLAKMLTNRLTMEGPTDIEPDRLIAVPRGGPSKGILADALRYVRLTPSSDKLSGWRVRYEAMSLPHLSAAGSNVAVALPHAVSTAFDLHLGGAAAGSGRGTADDGIETATMHALLNTAANTGVQVVLLPEFLFAAKSVEAVHDWWETHRKDMLVLAACHGERGSVASLFSSTLIDGRNRSIRQDKRFSCAPGHDQPVRDGGEFQLTIGLAEQCAFAVAICRDLNDDLADLLSDLGVDLVLVSACVQGLPALRGPATRLVSRGAAHVVVACGPLGRPDARPMAVRWRPVDAWVDGWEQEVDSPSIVVLPDSVPQATSPGRRPAS